MVSDQNTDDQEDILQLISTNIWCHFDYDFEHNHNKVFINFYFKKYTKQDIKISLLGNRLQTSTRSINIILIHADFAKINHGITYTERHIVFIHVLQMKTFCFFQIP